MNADIQKYAWTPVMRLSKAGRWTNTTTMLMQTRVSRTSNRMSCPILIKLFWFTAAADAEARRLRKKLADIGYTNVYEFGGINTWTGEIVK